MFQTGNGKRYESDSKTGNSVQHRQSLTHSDHLRKSDDIQAVSGSGPIGGGFSRVYRAKVDGEAATSKPEANRGISQAYHRSGSLVLAGSDARGSGDAGLEKSWPRSSDFRSSYPNQSTVKEVPSSDDVQRNAFMAIRSKFTEPYRRKENGAADQTSRIGGGVMTNGHARLGSSNDSASARGHRTSGHSSDDHDGEFVDHRKSTDVHVAVTIQRKSTQSPTDHAVDHNGQFHDGHSYDHRTVQPVGQSKSTSSARTELDDRSRINSTHGHTSVHSVDQSVHDDQRTDHYDDVTSVSQSSTMNNEVSDGLSGIQLARDDREPQVDGESREDREPEKDSESQVPVHHCSDSGAGDAVGIPEHPYFARLAAEAEEPAQILSRQGTIRGVKNRVRAGIATLLGKMEGQKTTNYAQLEKGKVVFYTTSVTVVRDTSEKCQRMKRILETQMVEFEERDVFISKAHHQELFERLQPDAELPQLFVDGHHLGGVEDIEKINENGTLRRIFSNFKKVQMPSCCPRCGGYRFIPCPSCRGSKKSTRNFFTNEFCALRCTSCDDNGLVKCDLCNITLDNGDDSQDVVSVTI